MGSLIPPRRTKFGHAVTFLIDRIEGGGKLVKDPDDRGGTTRWGISQGAYPALDIENLTRDGAELVYHTDYWMPINGDALDEGLAIIVFGAAVNCGVRTASKILQVALRTSVVDGKIGPNTLNAAARYRPASELRVAVTDGVIRRYDEIVNTDKSQLKYYHGWRMRALRFLDEAGRISGMFAAGL